MVPNEQNQHFLELRQKVGIYIQKLVLLTGLPSLDGKNEHFVRKKKKKTVSQVWVRQTITTSVKSSLKSPLFQENIIKTIFFNLRKLQTKSPKR